MSAHQLPPDRTESGIELEHSDQEFSLYRHCLAAGMNLTLRVEAVRGWPTPYRITTIAQTDSGQYTIFQTIHPTNIDDSESEEEILKNITSSFTPDYQVTINKTLAQVIGTRREPQPIPTELTEGQVQTLLKACIPYNERRRRQAREMAILEEDRERQTPPWIYDTRNVISKIHTRDLPTPIIEVAVRTIFPVRTYTPKELELPERINYKQLRQLTSAMRVEVKEYNPQFEEETWPSETVVDFFAKKGVPRSMDEIREKMHRELFPRVVPATHTEQMRSAIGSRGGHIAQDAPKTTQPNLFDIDEFCDTEEDSED